MADPAGKSAAWPTWSVAEFAKTWSLPVESPGLGVTREAGERWSNAMSAWLAVTQARADHTAVLMDAWRRVFEETLREARPDHPRALFTLSVELADRVFSETFRSPRFLETQRQLLEAVAACRMRERELVEDFASVGHVATRAEIDEAYRQLEELRRDVRALRSASRKP